ncbi:hypothetical protein ABZV34_23900 [Streptomyces sp. NPDC005195]|uniref:hypothetical protein n=1 Tax=Streptomyces sp. NPDC005195 TaxID=3154561 RepID=UPI0033BD018A
MSAGKAVGSFVTVAALLARATAYGVRAALTKRAVERLEKRYKDRADSARYLSEAMGKLEVDEPTTSAYMEVSTLSEAMAANVQGIVGRADSLQANAQGLAEATEGEHGRMRDANRTHTVKMADRRFIQPR